MASKSTRRLRNTMRVSRDTTARGSTKVRIAESRTMHTNVTPASTRTTSTTVPIGAPASQISRSRHAGPGRSQPGVRRDAGLLHDEGRHHPEHAAVTFGVVEDVAVERPHALLGRVDEHR